jgi:uncharacterized protein YcgI (DUF1989 family)
MLFAPCGPEVYRQKFNVEGWHPSCEENFHKALAAIGWTLPTVPDPVNVFQNSPLRDGELVLQRTQTKPGDRVTLRAEIDLVLVLTACSSDLAPTNGGHCTSMGIEVTGPWPRPGRPG